MEEFKQKVKLVFVGYGSKEIGGDRAGRGGDPKAATEGLKAAGINAHFYVSPDTAHEWQSWRRCLYQMAPLLFKDKPAATDTSRNTNDQSKSLRQPDPKFLIFLCFGQSNMEGGAKMEEMDREVNKRFQVMADFDNLVANGKKVIGTTQCHR